MNWGLGGLIILFIGVIAVFAMLPEVSNTTTIMTEKQNITLEPFDMSPAIISEVGSIHEGYNFTITNYPTTWRITDCPVTDFVLWNQTQSALAADNYTLNASTGKFSLKDSFVLNKSIAGNTSYISYFYCDEGYVASSSGRTVTKLILVFAAIGILAFVIFYAVKEYL